MGEKQGYLPFPKHFETICVHHTANPSTPSTPSTSKAPWKDSRVPIVTSNMSMQENVSKGFSAYSKGRINNPTRFVLEQLLGVLNKAKYCLCFSSGLGAITAVAGLLKSGDHIISTDDVYGGTYRLFDEVLASLGIKTSFVDFTDFESVEKAITPQTKLMFTENPTNPSLKVIDLCKTVETARGHNILVAVDNTFLTPYFQRPLEFGVDLVVHSISKYINGHSDVIMGCVCMNNEDLFKKMKYLQQHFGHVPSPFDCYQVIRSIKTLPQRMRRHHQNGLEVAKYLMSHPKIEEVLNPGLPCHPQHELFKKQTSGNSGMVSFYLKGGIEESKRFVSNLKKITHAVSLGGYESSIEIPSYSSHKTIPDEMKKTLKMGDNFVRFSVGLEDINDILEDLEQSLAKV